MDAAARSECFDPAGRCAAVAPTSIYGSTDTDSSTKRWRPRNHGAGLHGSPY